MYRPIGLDMGWSTFLWLSNLTLMVAFVATWGQWRFLASLAAVGGLMAELAWSIDFVVTAVLRLMGSEASGFTEYVFRPELAVWLRVLGGFHLLLPPLLIWMIYRLGYDRRALRLAVPLGWLLLAVSWLFTAPERNINLVYSYLRLEWLDMNAPIYLLFAAFTLAGAMAVTHLILMMALGRRTFPK